MKATERRSRARVFDGQYMHRHLLFISVRDDVWYSAQLSVHHVAACRKSGDCIIGAGSEKRTSAPPHSGRGRCQTMATTAADASVATDISVFQGRPPTIHRVRKNMLGCYDRPDENCAVSACSCRHQVSRGRHASSGHPGRHVPRYDPQTSGDAAEAASRRPGGRGGSAFPGEGEGDARKEISKSGVTHTLTH